MADVFKGWILGLQSQGIDTGAFNLDARLNFFGAAAIEQTGGDYQPAFSGDHAAEIAIEGLFAELYKYHPVDVVLIVSGFYVPPVVMKMIGDHGTKVVLLHTESPYEDDTQIQRSEHADLVLINDPTNLDKFREVNPNTHYQWHCFEPRLHYPGKAEAAHRSQFAFVGTGFKSRIDFLEQVNWQGIDIALAGHWAELDEDSRLRGFLAHDIGQCCANEDTVKLYQGTQISANIYRKESEREGLEVGWAIILLLIFVGPPVFRYDVLIKIVLQWFLIFSIIKACVLLYRLLARRPAEPFFSGRGALRERLSEGAGTLPLSSGSADFRVRNLLQGNLSGCRGICRRTGPVPRGVRGTLRCEAVAALR